MNERTPTHRPISDLSLLLKTVFLALAALAVAGANSVEMSKERAQTHSENLK